MTLTHKPYAESCDQNAQPIFEVLRTRLPAQGELLEIGSGTGQHAVMFARALPGITWHTSDRSDTHDGIRMWLDEVQLPNLRYPIALDVLQDPWPAQQFDVIFTANTAHIMSMPAVEAMFTGIARVLKPGALFLIYGPFMYGGQHTSASNQRFDHYLREIEPQRGIRDLVWLKQLAATAGLALEEDVEMPVNNRILVWRLEK